MLKQKKEEHYLNIYKIFTTSDKDDEVVFKIIFLLNLYLKIFDTPKYDIKGLITDQNIQITYSNLVNIPNKIIYKKFRFVKALGVVGKKGVPYIFRYGLTDFIIKESPNIKLESNTKVSDNKKCSSKYTKTTNSIVEDSNNPKKSSILLCMPKKITETNFLCSSSEYINETIIGNILNKIFFPSYYSYQFKYKLDDILIGKPYSSSDFANSVFQLGIFQTDNGNYGFNAMEKADGEIQNLLLQDDWDKKIILKIGDEEINDINKKTVMIIQQVINILQILKKDYDFNHGDLKAGNVFYKISDKYLDIDYPLKGYEYYKSNKSNSNKYSPIRTNIRVKIADYGKSSINYNGIRYYCMAKMGLQTVASEYDYSKIKDGIFTIPKTNFFTSYKADLNYNLRHNECPFLLSVDFYIFIISMLVQIPKFCNFLFENKLDEILFKNKSDQFKSCIFQNDTKNKIKKQSVTYAMKMIQDFPMSCSILDDFEKVLLNSFS